MIATDVAPPTTGTLARIHDSRATQYWDPDRTLSADIVRSVLAAPDRYGLDEELDADSVVWDTVAVFPAGARWERDLPVPTFYGYPIVQAAGGLSETLDRARAPGSGPSRP